MAPQVSRAALVAWLRLAQVAAPAMVALSVDDGQLAWYVSSAGLVVSLLWELQRGRPLPERLACWLGMLVYAVAAGFGLATESGAVSAGGLWLLLAALVLAAEGISRAGQQSWPRTR